MCRWSGSSGLGAMLDLGAADLELPPMTIRLLVPQSQEMLIPEDAAARPGSPSPGSGSISVPIRTRS